ncbi:regulatory protein RecX [Enterococcus florum]|uniref:Regulatory protein RecX n=1 Tax=Enterococcus florum TaxID=2480627 RepID=A0A4P5P4K7_9ENTE|nr:recombination regulator RecX [Enterococcus florum]GCF92356.1 regulatory protein RecX [Enterococcus florum]
MITVNKVNKGRNGHYDIELSNGDRLIVSEDVLVRFRLLKGQELTEQELVEIKEVGNEDLGFQLALNYLSYQMRSEKEVRSYLKEKEIEQKDRTKIIDRLKKLDLVNDQNYAESYIRTQMRLADKGPRVLRQKLQEKGISGETLENALALFEEQAQYELASKTAAKALKKFHHKSVREIQQKLQQQLMTKGFSNDTIKQVIADIDFEEIYQQEADSLQLQGEKLWRQYQRFDLAKRSLKTKQNLYQKGYQLDAIDAFIAEKKEEQDEE